MGEMHTHQYGTSASALAKRFNALKNAAELWATIERNALAKAAPGRSKEAAVADYCCDDPDGSRLVQAYRKAVDHMTALSKAATSGSSESAADIFRQIRSGAARTYPTLSEPEAISRYVDTDAGMKLWERYELAT